jgi:hypothetical protein
LYEINRSPELPTSVTCAKLHNGMRLSLEYDKARAERYVSHFRKHWWNVGRQCEAILRTVRVAGERAYRQAIEKLEAGISAACAGDTTPSYTTEYTRPRLPNETTQSVLIAAPSPN